MSISIRRCLLCVRCMLYCTNEKDFDLDTIVFDLNGTLVVGGLLDARMPDLLCQLRERGFRCVLLTGDQRGAAASFEQYGLEIIVAKDSAEKRARMETIDGSKVIAIGNARIDIGMFALATIRIATLQGEGIHTAILPYVDIVLPSIVDAMLLFLDQDRFAATMKI